jgi:hypothetical protein
MTITATGAAIDGGPAGTATPPIGTYDTTTKHNVLGVFADYRTKVGLATVGLGISEPFRANVKVGGQQRTVLVQIFERRVLTYNGANPDAFKVEMGNIGAHYYLWRYGQPLASVQPAATPPPAPNPAPTAAAPASNTLPILQGGTPYTDPSNRFRTSFPAGWTVKVDSDNNINFLALPNAGPAGINVSPRPVDVNMTLEDYKQNDLDWLVPRLKDYRQLSDTKIMVGPYPGYKRVFTQTNDEGQYEEIVRYYIRAGNYVFVVNCYCAPQDESKYMAFFDGTTGGIRPLGS